MIADHSIAPIVSGGETNSTMSFHIFVFMIIPWAACALNERLVDTTPCLYVENPDEELIQASKAVIRGENLNGKPQASISVTVWTKKEFQNPQVSITYAERPWNTRHEYLNLRKHLGIEGPLKSGFYQIMNIPADKEVNEWAYEAATVPDSPRDHMEFTFWENGTKVGCSLSYSEEFFLVND